MSSPSWTLDPAGHLAEMDRRRSELVAAGKFTPEAESEYLKARAWVDFIARNRSLPGEGGKNLIGGLLTPVRSYARGFITNAAESVQGIDREIQAGLPDFMRPSWLRGYRPEYKPSEMAQGAALVKEVVGMPGMPTATPPQDVGSLGDVIGGTLGGMTPAVGMTVAAAGIPGVGSSLAPLVAGGAVFPSVSQQTYEEALPRLQQQHPNMPQPMAAELAQDAARKVGAFSAGTSALLSSPAAQRLAGGLLGDASKRFGLGVIMSKDGALRPAQNALLHGALGVAEEGGQEAAETAYQNYQLGKPVGQDVGQNFLLGGLLGGPISAAGAGAGSVREAAARAEENKVLEQQKQEAQKAEAARVAQEQQEAQRRAVYDEELAQFDSAEKLQAALDAPDLLDPEVKADPLFQERANERMAALTAPAEMLPEGDAAQGPPLPGRGFEIQSAPVQVTRAMADLGREIAMNSRHQLRDPEMQMNPERMLGGIPPAEIEASDIQRSLETDQNREYDRQLGLALREGGQDVEAEMARKSQELFDYVRDPALLTTIRDAAAARGDVRAQAVAESALQRALGASAAAPVPAQNAPVPFAAESQLTSSRASETETPDRFITIPGAQAARELARPPETAAASQPLPAPTVQTPSSVPSETPPVPASEAAAAHSATGPLAWKRAVGFVSPNTEEGLDVASASKALLEGRHHEAVESIERDFRENGRLDIEVKSGLGIWSDGAENTIAIVDPTGSRSEIRAAVARHGKKNFQKGVIAFWPSDNGNDVLWAMRTSVTDPREVSRILLASGIEFHTILPIKGGFDILVYDGGWTLQDGILEAGSELDVGRVQAIRGEGEFIGAETREEAQLVYDRILEEEASHRVGRRGTDQGRRGDRPDRREEEPATQAEAGGVTERELRAEESAARDTHLSRLAAEAKARLAKRKNLRGSGLKGQIGGTSIYDDLADYAIIGAAHLEGMGFDALDEATAFAEFSKRMLADFGERVRAHLKPLFERAKGLYRKSRDEGQEAPGVRAGRAAQGQGRPEGQEAQPVQVPAGRVQEDVEPSVKMERGREFTISHGLQGRKDARYLGFSEGRHHYEYRATDGSWKPEARADEAFARAIGAATPRSSASAASPSAGGPAVVRAKAPASDETPMPTERTRPALWHEALATEGDVIKRYGPHGKELRDLGFEIRKEVDKAKGNEVQKLQEVEKALSKRKDWRKTFSQHIGWIAQRTDFKALREKWERELAAASNEIERAYARRQLAYIDKVRADIGFNPSDGLPEAVQPLVDAWHEASAEYKSHHEAVAGEAAVGRLKDYFPHLPSDEMRLSVARNSDEFKAVLARLERRLLAENPKLSAAEAGEIAADMLVQGDAFRTMGHRAPKAGSLEFHRMDIFGPADLDMSTGVMGKWFEDAAKSIVLWKALGKVGADGKVEKTPTQGLDELLSKLARSMDEPKWLPIPWIGDQMKAAYRQDALDHARAYAHLVMGLPLAEDIGLFGRIGRGAARSVANYQYRSKLASIGFNLINNLQYLTFSPAVFNLTSTLKGVADYFSPAKRQALASVVADIHYSQFEERGASPEGAVGRALHRTVDRAIRDTESFQRRLGALGGARYAEALLQLLKARQTYGSVDRWLQNLKVLANPLAGVTVEDGAGGMARRRLKEIFRLTDAQIDEAIAKGSFEAVPDPNTAIGRGTLADRNRYIAAHEINFGRGPDFTHRRLLSQNPVSTLLRTFQQFGLNAAKITARDVFRETFKGNLKAPGAIVAMGLTGELAQALTDALKGPQERESDYEETWWGRLVRRAQEDLFKNGVLAIFDGILTGRKTIHASTIKNVTDLVKAVRASGFGDLRSSTKSVQDFLAREIRAWGEVQNLRRRATQEFKDSPIRITDINRTRRVVDFYRKSLGADIEEDLRKAKDKDPAVHKARVDLLRDALINVSDPMTAKEMELIEDRTREALLFIAERVRPEKTVKGETVQKNAEMVLDEAIKKLEASLKAKGPVGGLGFASENGKYQPKKADDFYAWVKSRQRERIGVIGDTLTVDKIMAMQALYEKSVEAALQGYKQ